MSLVQDSGVIRMTARYVTCTRATCNAALDPVDSLFSSALALARARVCALSFKCEMISVLVSLLTPNEISVPLPCHLSPRTLVCSASPTFFLRSVDCSLTPQHYRYVCPEAGQYSIQLEHSARAWSNTRSVQIKVFVEETPMASHAEDVVHQWIQLHLPEHEHKLLPHVPSSSNLRAQTLSSSTPSSASLTGGRAGALSNARDSDRQGPHLTVFDDDDDDHDDDHDDDDDDGGEDLDRELEEEHNRIMSLLHSMLQNPLSHQRTPV